MSLQDELVDLTIKLISFPSVSSDKEENKKVLDFIKKYANKHGLKYKEYSSNGYGSLVLSNKEIVKNADIILHGHVDVVPTDDPEDFKPKVRDGKIYGRGAMDMKGGVAVILTLLKDLKESDKNVLVFITTEEETGGADGTEYLLNQGYRAKFFITAEGEHDNILKVEQKGVLWLKIKSEGLGAHAGYTWKGENAITKLMNFYYKLEKLFPHNPKDPKRWYTTINLGLIKGGHAPNAVPESAEGVVDIRYGGNWTSYDKVLKEVNKLVKKEKGIEIEVMEKIPMMKTDINNPLLQKLHEIMKKKLGLKKDAFYYNPGTNDARFASVLGIPAVGYGPLRRNAHARNEYGDVQNLSNYYAILQEFIERL